MKHWYKYGILFLIVSLNCPGKVRTKPSGAMFEKRFCGTEQLERYTSFIKFLTSLSTPTSSPQKYKKKKKKKEH